MFSSFTRMKISLNWSSHNRIGFVQLQLKRSGAWACAVLSTGDQLRYLHASDTVSSNLNCNATILKLVQCMNIVHWTMQKLNKKNILKKAMFLCWIYVYWSTGTPWLVVGLFLLCNTAPLPYNVTPCNTMSCNVTQYHTTPYNVTQYHAIPGWFRAFFSCTSGQFLLRIPPGKSRVWSHAAQWSFTFGELSSPCHMKTYLWPTEAPLHILALQKRPFIFSVTRRSRSDSVSQWVSESVSDSKNRVDWCDPGEWRYLLKTLLRGSDN